MKVADIPRLFTRGDVLQAGGPGTARRRHGSS